MSVTASIRSDEESLLKAQITLAADSRKSVPSTTALLNKSLLSNPT